MVVVALAVGGTAGALLLGGRGAPGQSTAPPAAAPDAAGVAAAGTSLAASISALQASLAASPTARGYAQLGAAYVQQARLTSDPTAYARADQALQRSLALQPEGDTDALIGQGALAAGRHDFAAALALADQALALNAFSSSATGVRVDALTELGRYPEAQAAVQRMLDLHPDVASLSRASYQLELRGETDRAREALERARSAAPSPSDVAFTEYYLGELAWNSGQIEVASGHYAAARSADSAYLPAVQGEAKVALARGDAEAALRGYDQLTTALPSPSYLIEQVDLLDSLGRTAQAQQQAAVLDAEVTLFRTNGASVDLELSLYLADHGRGQEALQAAQAEYAKRPSVVVADALAWGLHAVGRDTEALPRAQEAAHLGTRSALAMFHRGVIERALGLREPSRRHLEQALATNPHFSPVLAPEARRLLSAP